MELKLAVYSVALAIRIAAFVWAVLFLRRLRSRESLVVVVLVLLAIAVQAFSPDLVLRGIRVYAITLPTSLLVLFTVGFVGRTFVQRREAFRRLQDSEARHRAILENISDAVFTTDEAGGLVYVGPSVARLLGISVEEARKKESITALLGEGFPCPAELEGHPEVDSFDREIVTRAGERRSVLVAVRRVSIDAAAFLFVCRDITERERSHAALTEALTEVSRLKERLEAENLYLQEEIRLNHNFEEIVGNSPELHEALRRVEQVADTDATVLICGETGVGKELFARAIHNLSGRRRRALVRVDCSTLPPSLIESELFGHERGAFTGATARKFGRFELADGGTIFLDEIGELPLSLQPKLLRILEEGEFERIGGTETLEVDVRVLAATNRDLAAEVEEGGFRSDLYFRIDVFPIVIPPLRERRQDVPELARFFLDRFQTKYAKRFEGFTVEAIRRLRAYAWPGNVRELENVIERAVIAGRGPVLRLPDPLGSPSRGSEGLVDGVPRTLKEIERRHIEKVLQETNGVVQGPDGAAGILGLNPSTLRSRMKKLGIRPRR